MSKVIRSVKNVTKGYSSVQVKVRNATSNDPWGPTGTEMSEIAQMTYNSSTDFYEIMEMIDKRLNDKGKNWRHVLKALKVLDYCLHEGSELVVTWARENVFIIKTLREFQHIDDDGRDVGQNVRVSAKELTSLIMDEDRLRAERNDRKTWKSRVTGIEEYNNSHQHAGESSRARPRRQRNDDDDAEYKLALEASKFQEEEDRKKRESRAHQPDDDDDLAKAIKLSKEEEELRRRQLEEQNAASLFDDTPTPTAQPQYTGFNQGYQQQGAVDWSGNPIDQSLQAQPTGYMGNVYAQPTGYQNGYQNGFAQQQTGFDPYGQPQSPYGQQQTAFGQQGFQPQQTGFQPQPTGFNPWGAQQQQQEPIQPVATNNPWATGQQQQQQQPLKPTPTGSNNPFAASSFGRSNALSPLPEQKTMSQFNNTSNFNPPTTFTPPPVPSIPQNVKPVSEHEQRLNALLSSGDGMDTFGNTGNLRIPAQHTAPGTFVNSAGSGLNKLTGQATGTNPFLQSQFTGMPRPQYGNSSGAGGGGQGMMPAATGPAGMNGANGFGMGGQSSFGASPGGYGGQQNSNPFGAQQGGQHGGGNDLIQL